MPETASTRTTDRDRLRSRLVSPRSTATGASAGVASSEAAQAAATRQSGATRGRPAQFEQSPVLFSLPAIAPAEPVEVVAAGESFTGEQSRNRQCETNEIRNDSEIRSDDEVTLDIAGVAPQAHSPSPAPHVPDQLSSCQSVIVGPSAEDVAVQSHLASRVEAPQAESAQAAAPVSAIETNSDQKRTWWEHWSSGVVLILLVVALVVASIIALNDGGKVKSDQMAGQLEESMLDEFDLSSIAIPDISMPPLTATADRPLNPVVQNSPTASDTAASATATVPAIEQASSEMPKAEVVAVDNDPSTQTAVEVAVEAAAVEQPAGQVLAADNAPRDNAPRDKAAVDIATTTTTTTGAGGDPAVGSGGVAANLAGQAAPESAVQTTTDSIPPLPLATLDRPTEVAAPQLFAPGELPAVAGSSADPQPATSLSASNPTVSLELPRSEATRAEGGSPTFYDGASVASEQHTVSGSPVSGAIGGLSGPADQPAHGSLSNGPISTSAIGPVDTNMPDISTVLASATASVASGDAPTAQVVTSATPDLNGESIVEAYLRFQRLHQATTGSASNRYPDPPPQH